MAAESIGGGREGEPDAFLLFFFVGGGPAGPDEGVVALMAAEYSSRAGCGGVFARVHA
jgi:hypothetical protein